MAKPREVVDEYGIYWLIFDTDPAAPLVKQLDKWHVSTVILPRDTIKSGILNMVEKPDFSNVTDEMLEIPEVRQMVIRKTRAWEIYEHLASKESAQA